MCRRLAAAIISMMVLAPALKGEDAGMWLKRLDGAIASYPEYIAKRTAYIDSVRQARHETPFAHEMALQQAFMSFSLDSALTHSHKALQAASTGAELARAQMALALIYVTSGVMYKEAYEIFNRLDREEVERSGMLFDYYSLGVQLNRNLAAHSLDPALKSRYLAGKVAYRDSAIMLRPDNDILLANRYIDNGDYSKAINILSASLPDGLTTRGAAVNYNVLAQVYLLQGNRDMARKYLAQSALCDLSNGVREYLSLQDLAMMLYEDGDYERAYNYIHQSIEDATACNAKLRMLEMSEILPIIDKAHEQAQARSRNFLYALIAIVTLLTVALYVALRAKHRQHESLAKAYDAQQSLNERLSLSDSIKEEYIMRFMTLCLDYLAQMESYRRNLLRIASRKEFDNLCEAIKSSKYIDKGISDFYSKFDSAFLNLFPTFISDLKTLLVPGYSFNLKRDEQLNTELRIVALTRLGIADGDSICRFLRCSQSTVYNYRSKLRNNALNRDTFDTDIMKIGR